MKAYTYANLYIAFADRIDRGIYGTRMAMLVDEDGPTLLSVGDTEISVFNSLGRQGWRILFPAEHLNQNINAYSSNVEYPTWMVQLAEDRHLTFSESEYAYSRFRLVRVQEGQVSNG